MTKTAVLLNTEEGQVVRLPDEFRLPGQHVTIRRDGTAVILEPMKGSAWPPGFFDAIHIDDPAFQRPDQGELPPPAVLD